MKLAVTKASSVFYLVTLALGNVTPVSTWFFTPPDNIIARANGKPVDDRCVAHSLAGSCEFYRCFEQRLPCREKGYMLRFGQPYCRRFQQTLHAFTPEGRTFINATGPCLTRALLANYRQDQVDCHRLSHDAFDAVSSCYAAHGFCQVVKSNAVAFADVYQPRHLFQTGALKIWREIMEITYHCEPDKVHSFATGVVRLLSKVLDFFTSLGKLHQKLHILFARACIHIEIA